MPPNGTTAPSGTTSAPQTTAPTGASGSTSDLSEKVRQKNQEIATSAELRGGR